MEAKDLVNLTLKGNKKLCNNPDSDLTPREIQTILRDFNLKGTKELTSLVEATYTIGYEQGYRDAVRALGDTISEST